MASASFDPTFVGPEGSYTPKVYIIVGMLNTENLKKRSVLVDDTRLLLEKILREVSIPLEDVRICPAIPFKPIVDITEIGLDELKPYYDAVLKDIEKTNPKMIIALGNAAKYTLGVKDTISDARVKPLEYKGIPVKVTYSLTYIKNTDGLSSRTGRAFLSDWRIVKNTIESNNPVKTEINYTIVDVFNTLDLSNALNSFTCDEKIILDYETSGLNPHSVDFHLGGIGLSSLDGEKCFYVYFYDFWRRYDSNNPPPESSMSLLREFFKSKSFIVYNLQYECAVTISESVGIGVDLKNVEDILMWLRCLATPGSLKQVASERLGIKKWNDDVDLWVNSINEATQTQRITASMKNSRKEISWMQDNTEYYFDIIQYFYLNFAENACRKVHKLWKAYNSAIKKIRNEVDSSRIKLIVDKIHVMDFFKKYPSIKALCVLREGIVEYQDLISVDHPSWMDVDDLFNTLDQRSKKCFTSVLEMSNISARRYDSNLYKKLNLALKSYMLSRINAPEVDGGVSYSEIPLEIVAPYCASDCVHTANLYYNVLSELREKDLEIAATYYVQHGFLGCVLDRNGIAWNDDLAEKLNTDYKSIALESLRSLILMPRMLNILKLKDQEIMEVQSTLELDVLKGYFNPESSYAYADEKSYFNDDGKTFQMIMDEENRVHKTTSINFCKLLRTRRFKLAAMFYELHEIFDTYESVDEFNETYPVLYPLYVRIIDSENKLNTVEEILSEIPNIAPNLKYSDYVLYSKYVNWKQSTFNREAIEGLYKVFVKILGVNPDDKSTWCDEFFSFYYYKLYKKVQKAINTYINGSNGRDAVNLIKKDSVYNKAPASLAKYSDRPAIEGEVFILRDRWGVNTANTKRWRAAPHTVPPKTELIDLRISRFDDGIRLHFDYSQAEVRTIAKMAEDESLLQAYEEGKDIHRFIASKIYKKPMYDVLDEDGNIIEVGISAEERGNAKGAVFSILYGSTIFAFAQKYTNNNIKAAEEFFSSFFDQFPKIKKFIDIMHLQGITHGWVPTIFGDPVSVDMPSCAIQLDSKDQMEFVKNPYTKNISFHRDPEEDKKIKSKIRAALRRSQNYCIQSTSSMIAGLSIFKLSELIDKDNLSSKIDCFTHDSCDIDLQIKDLIKLFKMIPKAAVDFPRDAFHLPMEVDYEIGISGNKLIELKELSIEGNTLSGKFEGKEKDVEELVAKLRKYGVECQYEVEGKKEKLNSMENLFIGKGAYAMAIGQKFINIEGSFKFNGL